MTDNWLLVKKQYWGISNYAGEEIIPCRYDKIEYDGENKLRLFYDNQTKHVLQIELDGDKVVKGDAPHLSFVTLSLIFFSFFSFFFLGFLADNYWVGAVFLVVAVCSSLFLYIHNKKYEIR